MAQKYEHFMDEADIGSGEKTPAEIEDLEQTKHLKEQQEQARQQPRPLDGASLQQVIEEQEYINTHESHTPHSVVDSAADAEMSSNKTAENVSGMPSIPSEQQTKTSGQSQRQPGH